MVADLSGRRLHSTIAQALTVLRNLEHRGAKGADPQTGDGAGILTQIPDEMFRAVCDFPLPPAGRMPQAWRSCRRGRGRCPRAGGAPRRA